MKLFFLRHGHTNYNERGLLNHTPSIDVHLTSSGIQQAQDAAKFLRHKMIDSIYVSELPRTQETARYINVFHSAPVITDKRLNDIRTGWEGRSYRDWKKHNELNPPHPNDESDDEMYARISAFLDDLKKQSHTTVIIVTHSDPLRFVFRYFGTDLPEITQGKRFPNGKVFEFSLNEPLYEGT